MLSHAASICLIDGLNGIITGSMSYDVTPTPDKSKEFLLHMNRAIYTGTGKTLEITTPLINNTKEEIVKIGEKFGVSE